MTRRFFLFALLMAIIPLPSAASAPRDPYQFFFEQSLWDLTEELEIAREEGKQGIFLFFEQDECPFCHRMKQTVLNQPEVQDYFRSRFHSIAVDIEGDIEIVDFDGKTTTQKDFARANRVRATPLLVFIGLEGKPVFKYVGAPTSVEEFLWMGEYVSERVYLQTDDRGMNVRFTRFKQMKRNNENL